MVADVDSSRYFNVELENLKNCLKMLEMLIVGEGEDHFNGESRDVSREYNCDL